MGVQKFERRNLDMRRKSILKQPVKSEQKPKAASALPNKNAPSNFDSNEPPAKSNLPAKRARKSSGGYGTRGTRGTIGLEQTITIVQKTTLRQEAPFAESCLPKTMKIAIESRELLFPLLSSFPSSWSFIDKVFVMLTPFFEGNVIKFYAKKGLCMAEICNSKQIEGFDKILSQVLLEKIETIKLENNSAYESRRV
jgi:hypothetical protein